MKKVEQVAASNAISPVLKGANIIISFLDTNGKMSRDSKETGINSHNYEITKFWCAVHNSLMSRWRRGANPSTLNAKDNILVPKVTAYQNQTLNPASRSKDIQRYYKVGIIIIIIIMVFSHTLIMGELCLFKIPTFFLFALFVVYSFSARKKKSSVENK